MDQREDVPNQYTADDLYPEYMYQPETIPGDIRDWMDHRRSLVDAWKISYTEFCQEFEREERCNRDSYDRYVP